MARYGAILGICEATASLMPTAHLLAPKTLKNVRETRFWDFGEIPGPGPMVPGRWPWALVPGPGPWAHGAQGAQGLLFWGLRPSISSLRPPFWSKISPRSHPDGSQGPKMAQNEPKLMKNESKIWKCQMSENGFSGFDSGRVCRGPGDPWGPLGTPGNPLKPLKTPKILEIPKIRKFPLFPLLGP